MSFTTQLISSFTANANVENAKPMAAYMKDNFDFLGIKAQDRKELFKQALQLNKTEVKEDFRSIAKALYDMPEREYQYCAVDMLVKQWPKHFVQQDIELIEYFIVTKSWWDSVDPLAKYVLGGYLKQFPDETDHVVQRFAKSENMWMNRSAILFQLGYKKETDAALLFSLCDNFSYSKEFFIQKAIGWALREYAKTNANTVREFVNTANLKPLSVREALKNI
ncbi:DNA alkylation repair protein [Flavobacterium sp. RNTU_13]|uniref:DNA alkylation repair protein n=1 Tax=Flavobacterium sp. RNTU_13 TaxID=3375145 RepID=UPI0039880BAD